MSLNSGTRLGPYEIRAPLGAGGMGEVYLGEDPRLGRQVAVKVLPESFATDESRLARFAQEARAAAALNHPHIAAVFDIGQEDGTHYMVQELLEGETLREVAESALPLSRALKLGAEIAEGLAAAHKAGIVHRDLKPDNVFVTEDGHAKILDFGLAKLVEPGGVGGAEASMSPTMLGTAVGEVMGTAAYMAPEQAEGADVDHRADIFALGCVLYELTTGRSAFAGKNVYETLSNIVSDEPAPAVELSGSAPPELQRIVRKCLFKDRELRYQYAAEVALDLQLLLRDVDAGIAAPTATDAMAAGSADPGARGPLAVLAVGALALVLGFAAGDWLSPSQAAPSLPMRTFEIPLPESHPVIVRYGDSSMSVSPDGRTLVFAAQGADGVPALFARDLDDVETRRIADVTGQIPHISPDSEWVVYRNIDGHMQKVQIRGGQPFTLGVRGLAAPKWAADGFIYLAGPSWTTPARFSENGGDAELIEIAGLPDGFIASRLALAEGLGLAFLDVARGTEDGGIAVLDLAVGDARILVDRGANPRWASSGHLLWTRDGAVFAAAFDVDAREVVGRAVPVLQSVTGGFTGDAQFTVSRDGTLVWVPGELEFARTGFRLAVAGPDGQLEQLSPPVNAYRNPQFSPDGGQIAVEITESLASGPREDIWVADATLGTMGKLTTGGAQAPVWSPDGQWIYYERRTEGDRDLWRRRADFSSAPELVVALEGEQTPTDISPDGSTLVYEEWVAESGMLPERDLWTLDLETGVRTPLVQSEHADRWARFSPDGAFVAYSSMETGQFQIYVLELATGRRWTVSPGHGLRPFWAPSGMRLYYAAGDQYAVDMVVDGELRISPPKVVFTNTQAAGILPDDVGPDGQLLTLVPDAPEELVDRRDRIMVRLNWFQELERLAPHPE